MYLRWGPKRVFIVRLMSCVMVVLLLMKFMSCHGANVVSRLLTGMVYVGGLLFSGGNKRRIKSK